MSFTPYLFFMDNCREAMTAYQEVLGGQLDLVTAADMPDSPPDAPKDSIMHAALTLPNGSMLFASDDPSATEDRGKVGFSVSYSAADPDEAARIFKSLSDGGETTMPLGETSWSPCFGMCTDRFGVPWMVGVDPMEQLGPPGVCWLTEQPPDERVAWRATEGADNAGVVTFHHIDDTTTKVMLQLDFDPDGFVEQVGDKLGIVKSQTKADLDRFKEFIEERGTETGAWRGDVDRPGS